MYEKSFENSIPHVSSVPLVGRERLARWLALGLRGAALALVVIVPLIVNPFSGDAYNLTKVLALYSGAVAIVAAWAGIYLLVGHLVGHPRWTITLAEIPLWLFVLAALVSSWVSVDARLTFFGAPGRHEGLLALLAYCVLYFVGVHFFGSEREFRVLAMVAGGVAVVTIGYGLSRLFLPPLFPNEAILKELYDTLGYRRAFSTLGNPVTFGGYLALMVPLLGGLGLASSGRGRVFWWSAMGLGYATLFVTFTRAAWLAVLIGTGVLVLAVGPRRFRPGRRLAVAAIAITVLAVGLTKVVITPAQLTSRTLSLFEGSGSVSQRMYIWGRTVEVIRQRPVLGWGLETLRDVFPYERIGLTKHFGLRPTLIDEAHNDILQMAVSIGIPGAGIYLLLWGAILEAAVRLWRRTSGTARFLVAGWLGALIAYFVQAQFSYSTVAIAPIVWILAGSAAGWETTTRE